MNILLVEPDYRSKFPPLGLMRLSAFHKSRGDAVTFVRGKIASRRDSEWHRIYISSLFTYELPRTIDTIKYYAPAVADPAKEIFVGGIGATLMPEYIRERVPCQVVEGALDKTDMLGPGTPPIADYIPDYDLLTSTTYKYRPEDSYFVRVTKGCIRKCKFCAVPILEPDFEYVQGIHEQLATIKDLYGERQHLIVLDNNVLAIDRLEEIIADIREAGFQKGARRNGRLRIVDFNQGIDARLITLPIAKLLSSICLSPIRLAFDFDGVEAEYRRAISLLAAEGFHEFTNYVMFNFNDTPYSFYRRLRVNLELCESLKIKVTGFPMRYIPVHDVTRKYISQAWNWRYLRGIQCVLSATHGMVSPNPQFFSAAFGETYEEFLEIIAMPDQYIMFREAHRREAASWRALYRGLSESDKEEFLIALYALHLSKNRREDIRAYSKFNALLAHYYPALFKKGT